MELIQAIRIAIDSMRYTAGIVACRPGKAELTAALSLFEKVNDKKKPQKKKASVLPDMSCPECVGGQLVLRDWCKPPDVMCGSCERVFTPARILKRILNHIK